MPYFEKDIILNEAQKFVGMWPKYGNSMNEVIVGVISNPLQVLKDIFTNKVFYKLYISWLFVPFKTFWVLLPSVAIIVFLIAEEPIRSLALYYSAPIIALIVISYIYGLNRFSSFNIKKIVSFAFALNLLIGIGGYRLASPRKDVFSIRESLDKRLSEVSIEKSKKIFISGHLLAQTDYRRDFRRIFDKTFFVREKDIINKVVIGKTVNNYPLNKSDVGNLIISLSENPLYEKEFEDQNIIIFRKL